MRLSKIDVLMGVGVALLWGMGIVVAKSAIEHFPPILLMALRFLVTAMALVWLTRPPVKLFVKIFFIAFVASAIQYSLTFTGLRGLDASVAALIVQLEVPFLVLLGVLFLKETAGIRKWIGIAIAFAGVILIAGAPRLNGAYLSMFLVVGGAFTWAVGQVMIRALKEISGLELTAWIAVFACPQLLFMSWLFESGQREALASAGWHVWGAVLYLGLIMTAIGYFMWYTLVTRHPVNMIAPFLLLLPVFSVIGGVVFLGEQLSVQIAMGGAIVIAGVGLILVERRSPLPAANLQD